MKILDACCGSRMFWFDKENSNVTYMDIRTQYEELDSGHIINVSPDFVAEWIEFNKTRKVPLEIILKCYKGYVDNRISDDKDPLDGAVDWFVNNPYEFVRAYEEGCRVMPQKYYWRKKKEHLAWFEGETASYLNAIESDKKYFLGGKLESLPFKTKFTEQEARDLLKDDFDKFEKVECD